MSLYLFIYLFIRLFIYFNDAKRIIGVAPSPSPASPPLPPRAPEPGRRREGKGAGCGGAGGGEGRERGLPPSPAPPFPAVGPGALFCAGSARPPGFPGPTGSQEGGEGVKGRQNAPRRRDGNSYLPFAAGGQRLDVARLFLP